MSCTICNQMPCVCPRLKVPAPHYENGTYIAPQMEVAYWQGVKATADAFTKLLGEQTDILKMKADLLSRHRKGEIWIRER